MYVFSEHFDRLCWNNNVFVILKCIVEIFKNEIDEKVFKLNVDVFQLQIKFNKIQYVRVMNLQFI